MPIVIVTRLPALPRPSRSSRLPSYNATLDLRPFPLPTLAESLILQAIRSLPNPILIPR